jgi:hypothetical protein
MLLNHKALGATLHFQKNSSAPHRYDGEELLGAGLLRTLAGRDIGIGCRDRRIDRRLEESNGFARI